MMTCFSLADRLKMDVREVADWPLSLIYHWVAFYKITKPSELDEDQ